MDDPEDSVLAVFMTPGAEVRRGASSAGFNLPICSLIDWRASLNCLAPLTPSGRRIMSGFGLVRLGRGGGTEEKGG